MKLKSSKPFWLVKNGIIKSYPSVRENLDTEILIVGGGITGSLIAHQCMADGYKTMLIDRRELVTEVHRLQHPYYNMKLTCLCTNLLI